MKKLFALLLAVLLVVSMAACASNQPAGTTAPKATQPAATKPAGTTAATTTKPKALNDLPFVEPGSAKITLGIQTNATVLDYDDNYYTKYIEEKTGVDIEFVFFSSNKEDAQQQLNLMVAAKEKLPDAILGNIVSTTMVRELAADGHLVDLTDYIENHSYWLKEYLDVMTPDEKALVMGVITNAADGKIYALPSAVLNRGIDSCGYIGGINKTMAKKFGMNWEEIDTVAEVYEFLKKAVHEDGNGNGEKDEIGLFYRQKGYRGNAELWVINAYVHVQDNYMWNVTDGEFWSPLVTDEYRQAMIELNKWYKEGLISPLSYSVTNDAEQMAVIETPENYKVAAFGGHPTLVCNADSQIGLEYGHLPVLKAESDLGGYAPRIAFYNVSTTGYSAVITSSAEDPLLTFRVLDFLHDDYSQQVARYGEEGVHWEYIKEGEENPGNFLYNMPATYRVLKDEWSEQTKATWHNDPIHISSINAMGNVEGHIGTYAEATPEHRNAISLGQLAALNAVGEPEETMKVLLLDEEEQEVYDTYRKDFRNFMFESRAEFITGVRDPNNDADWEDYLKELKAKGLEELTEAFQSAYTRLMG